MTPSKFATWRKAHGFSKVQAAKELGISLTSVSLYERGTRFDDNRPVVIPRVVELATEAVSYRRFG